jgi:putative acetyltransferase
VQSEFIRTEKATDRDAVYAVNVAAFPTPAEAGLVDALREQARSLISLVAEDHGNIVGHIMFSPVSLSAAPGLKIMGLAPMAVAPQQQRRGIGSALVRAGLEQCRQLDIAAVVVLGHPDYYPRFGFVPASHFGISCEYDVSDEVFMAIALQPGALSGNPGTAKYHSAFSKL